MKKFVVCFLFCVISSISYSADVTITWDANTEPDLAGYEIHYGNTSGCANLVPICTDPVDTFVYPTILGVPLGNLADPTNPSVTLTGLANGVDWFFVVVAYDDETVRKVSGYSNQAAALNYEGGAPSEPAGVSVIMTRTAGN